MHVSNEHLRVMLVDDVESLRFALGRVLRLYGFDVCEAVDGQDALDQMAGFRPQMVLTDLMMPVMDGVDLIRHLQSAPETSSIPILAFTANITQVAGDSAREAGAVDVLAKPVDLPQLLERLRGLPHSVEIARGDSPTAGPGFLISSPGLGCCSHRSLN